MPAYPEFDRVRSEVRPLGQLRDSFIIATDSSGLIVIDQHVAHERVLFEAYLRQKLAGKLEIQRLLMPIVVQLPPRQFVILDSIVPELARNGSPMRKAMSLRQKRPSRARLVPVTASGTIGASERRAMSATPGCPRMSAPLSLR